MKTGSPCCLFVGAHERPSSDGERKSLLVGQTRLFCAYFFELFEGRASHSEQEEEEEESRSGQSRSSRGRSSMRRGKRPGAGCTGCRRWELSFAFCPFLLSTPCASRQRQSSSSQLLPVQALWPRTRSMPKLRAAQRLLLSTLGLCIFRASVLRRSRRE